MTPEKYVNSIVKRIQCSNKKKKDIKKQLSADVNLRIEQGENIENIINEMGSIKEIADSFNENMAEEEKKKSKRGKWIKISISVIFVMVLITCLIYWLLPKVKDVSDSKLFHEKKIDSAIKDIVEKFDNGDYEALREKSTSEMKSTFDKETIENAKRMISDHWGKRERIGKIYMEEISQGNMHYAVSQVIVTYENVSVTFTITFDKDMRIAGLYMK